MKILITRLRLLLVLLLVLASAGTVFGQTAGQTVTLATLDWAPFLGKDMEDGGFVASVVRKALETQGVTANIRFYPWERCMALGKAGRIDGVIGAWYNEDRAASFHYSEPLLTNRKMLFSTTDSNVPTPYSSLRALSGYTIGITKGYTYTEEFDSASYLDKDPSPDLSTAFEKLFAQRNDIVVGAYYPALYIIDKDFPMFKQDVRVLKPALKEDPLYVIFPKALDSGASLRDTFNAGLAAIQENGTFDAILTKHGF